MKATPARIDRRVFLLGGAAGTALGALMASSCRERVLASGRLAPPRGLVLGPGSVSAEGAQRFHLSILDLHASAEKIRQIPLDFMAHGVVCDPLDPARAILFEKRGKGACEVDLRAGRVVRPLATAGEREFYGHGAFSLDGKILYATETDVQNGYRGLIVLRDGASLAELGEFPSFGESPHDCVLRDEGRTLWVTHGGGREPGGALPCVTAIDVRTRELKEKLEFQSPALTAGHLALSRRGDLAVLSSMREWMGRDCGGALSLRPAGSTFRTMIDPPEVTARMLGESLSVAIHEPTLTVAVTNPRGHLVTFWDLERGAFLKKLELAWPRGVGVTRDDSRFLISHGVSGKLLPLDAASLEPLVEEDEPASMMNGSHLFVHEPLPAGAA